MLTGPHIYLLYASGRVDEGIAAAPDVAQRQVSRFGESLPFGTRAWDRAVGYMRAGRDQEAASRVQSRYSHFGGGGARKCRRR